MLEAVAEHLLGDRLDHPEAAHVLQNLGDIVLQVVHESLGIALGGEGVVPGLLGFRSLFAGFRFLRRGAVAFLPRLVALGDDLQRKSRGNSRDQKQTRRRGDRDAAMPANEQDEMLPRARALDARGKAALIRGDFGLQRLDGFVAHLAAHVHRFQNDRHERLGRLAVGEVRQFLAQLAAPARGLAKEQRDFALAHHLDDARLHALPE